MKRPRASLLAALGVAIVALAVFESRRHPGGLFDEALAPGAPDDVGPRALDAFDAGARVPPRPSEGCGRGRVPNDDALRATTATTSRSTIVASGATRTYELVVPAGYDPSRPYPLVLAFHGSGGDGRGFHAYMRLEEQYGDGAIAIYPDAVVRRVWADHYATHWGRVEDLPFFDALVARAERDLCVDTARIFAVGWSSGGYFANQLGCVRPDVVRAFVALSGGGPEEATCTKPVPAFFHHDRDDGDVLVTTGRASRDAWLATNACAREGAHEAGGCTIYARCEAPVVWCETSGHGHGVPASAKPALWRFLAGF